MPANRRPVPRRPPWRDRAKGPEARASQCLGRIAGSVQNVIVDAQALRVAGFNAEYREAEFGNAELEQAVLQLEKLARAMCRLAERNDATAGRPMPDGERPKPGGWNRIHLVVDDLPAEVARLRAADVKFRDDIVTGPGGSQILLMDPAGNLVELFQAS